MAALRVIAVYIEETAAAKWNVAVKGGRSMNYPYLLECADHTLYCGWTNDLEKRVKAHNSGCGAKYTKARRPVVLVYFEEFQSKEEAMRRDAAIKKLTRREKMRLVEGQAEHIEQNGAEIEPFLETKKTACEETAVEKN